MLIQHDKRDQALSLRHIINMEKRIIGRILSFLELSISRELQADRPTGSGCPERSAEKYRRRESPSSGQSELVRVESSLHNPWTNLHKFCNIVHQEVCPNGFCEIRPASKRIKCLWNCGVCAGRECDCALTRSSGMCCRKMMIHYENKWWITAHCKKIRWV